ncbi:ATP-binding protein [Niveibacterium sp. COAC-50]|uniref:ATP-binding protein n=1 Tax=Niveibacterium sp. COAC-50 TaxID=2729384 RepID=UPI001557F85D|nr:ATP-binding protein [Niveibacterium sp. COAC-50]
MSPRLSLTARVVLIVTLALAAGGAGIGWLVFRAATGQAAELFDGQLVQTAEMLVAVAHQGDGAAPHSGEQHDADDHDDDTADALHGGAPREIRFGRRFRQVLVYQVWSAGPQPRQLARSPHAPDEWLPASSEGFTDARWAGGAWRFFRFERSGCIVIVGQNAEVRQRLVHEIGEHGFTPLAIGFLGVILLAWGAIALGLRPLSRLAGELQQRAPDQLSPLAEGPRPRELATLVAALNGLFARVARAFENERRFTADAAHELRTPLAAVAAQIQSVETAPDEAVRASRLRQALAGVQRMARLVEQLLAAARLDALDSVRRESVDLAQLARELAAERAAAALTRDVELALEAPDKLPAQVQPELMRALLRNLIDNAVRHAPPGSDVTLRLGREGARVRLSVSDAGTGVDAALMAQLGERFVRGEAMAGTTGAGLGLSIVRRIAALHGGELAFARADEGGLKVEVLIDA